MPNPVAPTPWLTLRAASDFLGIHPTTLRAWADEGKVRAFRTPGGHRRFRRDELQRFLNEGEPSDMAARLARLTHHALAATHQELLSASPSLSGWHEHYTHEMQKASKRESGQRMLGLTIEYLVREDARDTILRTGRALAQEYGRDAAQQGMSPSGIVRAFTFFRDALRHALESGTEAADVPGLRIQLHLYQFFHEMLAAALEGYEEGQRRAVGSRQ